MEFNRQLQAIITAIQFLTRIPVPGGMHVPDADRSLMRASVIYFPLIGGLVGGITGSFIWGAASLWAPMIAILLGLMLEAAMTGAFHEDAVADCCDAFGGGWTRDDVLRIMKDSRIGSYGALGLLLAVLLRTACLLSIPMETMIASVAASGAIGRWATLLLSALVPPIKNRDGLAKDVGEQISWREVSIGAALTLPGIASCSWLSPLRTAMGVVIVVIAVWLWSRYVRRRIDGMTGDCLGTGCYLAQCAFLLSLTAGREI